MNTESMAEIPSSTEHGLVLKCVSLYLKFLLFALMLFVIVALMAIDVLRKTSSQ